MITEDKKNHIPAAFTAPLGGALTAALQTLDAQNVRYDEVCACAAELLAPHDAPIDGALLDVLANPLIPYWNEKVQDAFLSMRSSNVPPVRLLAHIVLPLCARVGLTPDHPHALPLLMAIALGGVRYDLPYHNHHHMREVATIACALGLYTYGLDQQAEKITELAIAACLHDFAHDGQGNGQQDDHKPMRLEQGSVDKAYTYMKAAGMPAASCARMRAMILATDVTKPAPDARSPAELLRLACTGAAKPADCPPTLEALFDDKTLSHQASILSDADLGASAAMPYAFACKQSDLVAREANLPPATPKMLIGFLDYICHGSFTSPEGKTLFNDNIYYLRERALAEQQNP